MKTQAYRYLTGLGVVLWPGASWDLTDPKERVKAAEWLAAEFEAMEKVGRVEP